MVSFVVVRVPDDERLKRLLSQLECLALSYNVCSEENLTAPTSSETSPSTAGQDNCGKVVQATVTAEVMVSGDEIDLSAILGSRCNEDSGELKPSNDIWTEPCASKGLMMKPDGLYALSAMSKLAPPKRRVANNIKRYRRQFCKLCGSWNLVPFLRSKMNHAAIHSDFKRYKCPHCEKRGVSVATITLHIKSRHPGQPHNEYLDEMSEQEYVKLLLLTEKCFDDPYM